ncbi:hypothetical protein ACS0TY_002591 [Phlomoides rotata]
MLMQGCYVCIVAGYCEGGDMAELMRKADGQYFPKEDDFFRYMIFTSDPVK